MKTATPGLRAAASFCVALLAGPCLAQGAGNARAVHIVYMGGNDCPPCLAWRRTELPKLEQAAEFKAVQFSYVTKAITSTVPLTLFLPADVKPLKAKLDAASGGLSGSPQVAIFVNGEVYDYYRGSRSADEVLRMLKAIRTGTKYPFSRCLKIQDKGCQLKA
jgi:thiol-disulfide isomerase/thioredoxin